MSVKSKHRTELHSLHYRKTGAIGKAEILILVPGKYLPSALLICRGHGNHPDKRTFLQLLPEDPRSFITNAITDEGDSFRKNGVGGNQRERIRSENDDSAV